MTATRSDVDRWIATAKEKKAKYIISVCDTYDHDDYPVYVMPGQDVKSLEHAYNCKNMQRVNEVIELKEDGTVVEPRKALF